MFTDRREAGRRLAEALGRYAGRTDVVVVGLPRGGVPVAAQVAQRLGAPLDVIVVRKLGVPYHPEFAMGAIGENGVRFVDEDIVARAGVSSRQLASVERRERRELDDRLRRYRAIRPAEPLGGRTVIVVDDGVATGSTARAACQVVRAAGAASVVLAVPVAPTDWLARLGSVADDYVAVETPIGLGAVGAYYRDFRQTPDREVDELLEASARSHVAGEDEVGSAG